MLDLNKLTDKITNQITEGMKPFLDGLDQIIVRLDKLIDLWEDRASTTYNVYVVNKSDETELKK